MYRKNTHSGEAYRFSRRTSRGSAQPEGEDDRGGIQGPWFRPCERVADCVFSYA